MPSCPAVTLPEDDPSQASAHICIKMGETLTFSPILLTSVLCAFSQINVINDMYQNNLIATFQKHQQVYPA